MKQKAATALIIFFGALTACGQSSNQLIISEKGSAAHSVERNFNQGLRTLKQDEDPDFEYSSAVDQLVLTHSLFDGEDHGNQVIEMRLSPRQWELYLRFQLRVAQLIPEEERRPTVDLTLTEVEPGKAEKTIGILGGTGPLADGELIRSIMRMIRASGFSVDWRAVSINLFSAPPPRSFYEMTHRGWSYLGRVDEFATRGHDRYYLASNTAHSRIDSFSFLVRTTYFRKGISHSFFPVINLVQDVVQKVSAASLATGSNLLVLGTKAAYDAQLYPQYLKRAGWVDGDSLSSESDVPFVLGQYFSISSAEMAERFQAAIDLAKKGDQTETRIRMREIIFSEVAGLPKNNLPLKIIFGCTEIPMVFPQNDRADLVLDLNKYLGVGVEILDTGEIFSKKIASDLISIHES